MKTSSGTWLSLFLALALVCIDRPSPAAVYAVGADLSGTFYDPAQNGHGFIVEHIVSNGTPLVLVTWFTYLDGQQHWLVGVGSVSGNSARVPLTITRGGDLRLGGATYAIYPRPDNASVAAVVRAHPDRFLGWIFLNPRAAVGLDELERWRTVPGMIGVKLHPLTFTRQVGRTKTTGQPRSSASLTRCRLTQSPS